MNRRHLAVIATLSLVALSVISWLIAERSASPLWLAASAALKLLVIGLVFLELDQSHPLWGVLAALISLSILGGAAMLMGGL